MDPQENCEPNPQGQETLLYMVSIVVQYYTILITVVIFTCLNDKS